MTYNLGDRMAQKEKNHHMNRPVSNCMARDGCHPTPQRSPHVIGRHVGTEQYRLSWTGGSREKCIDIAISVGGRRSITNDYNAGNYQLL